MSWQRRASSDLLPCSLYIDLLAGIFCRTMQETDCECLDDKCEKAHQCSCYPNTVLTIDLGIAGGFIAQGGAQTHDV